MIVSSGKDYRRRIPGTLIGLGDADYDAIGIGGSGAGAGIGAAIGSSVVSAGISLAIAGVVTLIAKFLKPSLEGQQKIAATDIVNQAATLMEMNRDAFLNQSDHTYNDKVQALVNFDQLWTKVVQLLTDPALGEAGRRGLAERSPGSGYGITRTQGGIYDMAWFARKPIEEYEVISGASGNSVVSENENGNGNEGNVGSGVTSGITDGINRLTESLGSGTGGLLLIGGLGLIVVAMMSKDKGIRG